MATTKPLAFSFALNTYPNLPLPIYSRNLKSSTLKEYRVSKEGGREGISYI
jgi:hypothetical protein